MPQQLRHQAWIVVAAAVVFFTNLGATHLFDKDETLYASCAREMFQAGDWVVPTFNGDIFPDKPPLMYWLMMSGYALFGMTEFAVRFWSAVLGIGTALATYHIGRLLFRAEVGFWAGLCVGSSIIFTVSARAATVDSALTFATTLAMLAFVVGLRGRWREDLQPASRLSLRESSALSRSERRHSILDRSNNPSGTWGAMALMYAAMGVAVLAKGPIGVILPVGTIGLFLLLTTGKTREPSSQSDSGRGVVARCVGWLVGFVRLLTPLNLLRIAWRMRPLTALAVLGVIVVPWFVMVGLKTDGVWLVKFFGEQNLGRAMNSMQGHSGTVLFYVAAILIGFFPWSVFLGPSLSELTARIRRHHVWRSGYILTACWLGVYVVFWSLVSTKLPHYVLPAYPALALLTAAFVEGWIADPAHVRPCWGRNAAITMILVGVGILIAIPIVAAVFLPGEWPVALVGLIPVGGGAVCLYYLRRGSPSESPFGAMVVFAVTSVVFLTAMFGFAPLRIDRHQNAEVLLAAIRSSSDEAPDLAAYGFFKESYVFYAGRPVSHCVGPDALREFLDRAERPYIITSDEQEEEVERHFPGRFRVLARRPRFLHDGEVVVLTGCNDGDVPRTAVGPNIDTSQRR